MFFVYIRQHVSIKGKLIKYQIKKIIYGYIMFIILKLGLLIHGQKVKELLKSRISTGTSVQIPLLNN